MPKKRLDIDARMLDRSGIGTCLKNILPHLARLSAGFDIHLHGSVPRLRELVEHHHLNFQVHGIPDEPYCLNASLLPLGKSVFVENLWVPHYNVPWRGVKNLVVTVHDILHIRTDLIPRSLPQRLYARVTMERVRKNAKCIFFDSAFTKSEFEAHVGSTSAGRVVHIGVSDRWKQLRSDPPRRAFESPYLLFVGSQMKHKNLGFLIDTFMLHVDDWPYHLLIAGKMDQLRTKDSHPILNGQASHPRIHLLGEVSLQGLESLMFHASALVFPSIYEGFGLPPLEALACGTPALVSDIPVHREVLGNGATYFDPGDPGSLRDALERIPQAHSGKLPRDYSWETTGNQVADCLERAFS